MVVLVTWKSRERAFACRVRALCFSLSDATPGDSCAPDSGSSKGLVGTRKILLDFYA